jgi:hypothetical protein
VSAQRVAAMVGLSFALMLAGAGPALAGTATAPGQGNAANNCLNGGPAHSSGSPSTGGGCTGHFRGESTGSLG